MPEVKEAATVAGHMASGMRTGEEGDKNEHSNDVGASAGCEERGESSQLGGGGRGGGEEARSSGVAEEEGAEVTDDRRGANLMSNIESDEEDSDDESEGLEAVGRVEASGAAGAECEYAEDSDSEYGEDGEGSDGDADVDQANGSGGEAKVEFDPSRRTKLERVIVVPRVIQKRNDLAMAVIKSNWAGAAELGTIVYPLYRREGEDTVLVRAGTPPREALAIQERVMARVAALELYCVGLPEANGNEIRWRLATTDGLVLDFGFQLKQGSVLFWFPKGRGNGPRAVRDWAVDPMIPDEAPAGYPGGRGKFANECTRLAYVWVLSNTRAGFENKVLTLFDCSSFINQSEWTIREVLKDPHDISFGWFSSLRTTEPRLWDAYADRPILELIEKLKSVPRLREHRLVKGMGLANKTETFARAVLVIVWREQKKRRDKKVPWTLTTLRAFVTRAGWLDDLADVYITYVHDTLIVFGQSFDLRYHNEPKIDQLINRNYIHLEQPGARMLKRKAGDRYSHEQVFVDEKKIKAAPEAEKSGILAGHGGTWTLGRFGKKVNPDKTLASSMVGWHSNKDIQRMKKDCLVIGPREADIDGETYFSPDMTRDHSADQRKIGRMERLFRSWSDGTWRKRCDKYLAAEPFSRGFVFKEPLKEGAVGGRVRVYFPGNAQSHWGTVRAYDPKTEYYQVVFDDGVSDDMVWPQLIAYMQQAPKSPEEVRQARLARRKRKAGSEDQAKKNAKRERYNRNRKNRKKRRQEAKDLEKSSEIER